jgi:photosystem II stability/assembly factor-like uncharacterized protein
MIRSNVLLALILLFALSELSLGQTFGQFRQLPQLPGGQVRNVVHHPQTEGLVFALTAGSTYRSVDGGVSWRQVFFENEAQRLQRLGVNNIAFSPNDPNLLFALSNNTDGAFAIGDERALYQSSDGGQTWQKIESAQLESVQPGRLWVSGPTDPVLFINGRVGVVGQVFRSDDLGLSWQNVSPNDREFGCIFPQLPIESLLCIGSSASSETLLLVSEDLGTTWTQVTFPFSSVFDMVRDPSNPQRLFATGIHDELGRGVFRSDNLGASWLLLTDELISRPFRISTANPDFIYSAGIANRTRFFASVDGGDAWEDASPGPGSIEGINGEGFFASIEGMSINPFDHLNVLLAVDGRGIWTTSDGGQTWETSSDGLFSETSLLASVKHDGKPFTLAGNRLETRRTLANQTEWHWVNRVSGRRPNWSFVTDPISPSVIARANGVSVDGGENWVIHDNASTTASAARVAPIPGADAQVMLANGSGQTPNTADLVRSENGGASWELVLGEVQLSNFTSGITSEGEPVMYARSSSGIYRFKDAGLSWEVLPGTGIDNPPDFFGCSGACISLLVPERHAAERIWAHTSGGLYFSDDAAETWAAFTEFETDFFSRIALSSENNQMIFIYAAEPLGVMYSMDGGSTWQEIPREFLTTNEELVYWESLTGTFDHGVADMFYDDANSRLLLSLPGSGLLESRIEVLDAEFEFPADRSFSQVGDTIEFTGVVTNVSSWALTDIDVDFPGAESFSCESVVEIPPGGSMACSGQYAAVQGDLDRGDLTGVLVASALAPDGNRFGGTATDTTDAVQIPGLEIDTEILAGEGFSSLSEQIRIRVTVTAAGNVTLQNPMIDAQNLELIDCEKSGEGEGAQFLIGDQFRCDYIHFVWIEDLEEGSFSWTFYGGALDPNGHEVISDPAGITVHAERTNSSVAPQEINFGEVATGESAQTVSVFVSNDGPLQLMVFGFELEGVDADEFSATQQCSPWQFVPIEDPCEIEVTFTPTSAGIFSSVLRIRTSSEQGPHLVALQGTSGAVIFHDRFER